MLDYSTYYEYRITEQGALMRAVVMAEPSPGPDKTEVRGVDAPRPGPGQVAIGVAYAGLNFIDVMARRGDPGYASSWPYVPGLEVAGTVLASGAGVTGLEPGRRVAAFTRGGGLAEVAVAEAALTVPVPAEVTLPTAAAAPLMLSTAWLLLAEVTRIRPGESLLMHSAGGGIGGAVAQLAPRFGARVLIGTVGRPEKAAGALRGGWQFAFPRDRQLAESVLAAAAGPVDVILDPAGTDLLDLDIELAAPGGRIALFGNPGGGQPAPLPPLGTLIGRNIALAGFSMGRPTAASPGRAAGALRHVLELLAQGRIDVSVTELASLDDVPAAHQALAEGRNAGKFVVATGCARRG
jgi:NADPH:quinone reductase